MDVVKSWSVQMYYTPTSSGRCGEHGGEAGSRQGSGREASVLLMLQRDCMVSWYQCRLSELPSHPRRAPLYTPSRSLLRVLEMLQLSSS